MKRAGSNGTEPVNGLCLNKRDVVGERGLNGFVRMGEIG